MVVTTIYIVRHGVSFPSPYHQYFHKKTYHPPSLSFPPSPTSPLLLLSVLHILKKKKIKQKFNNNNNNNSHLRAHPQQFRARYNLSTSTGTYSSLVPSPTGIPSDPPLTSHGEEQSLQLADALAKINDPPIWQVYSSPFYRCLQTVEPFVKNMKKVSGMAQLEIRGDNGLG